MRAIRGRLRAAEIWGRWLDLAAELDLPPGEPGDLRLPGSATTLHAPDRAERALDDLAGLAHRRLDRFRYDPATRTLAIDPRATRSNLATLADTLAADIEAEHRRLVVADLDAEGRRGRLDAARVARRWGTSRRTLFRWAGEGVPKTPRNGTTAAGIPCDAEGSPAVPGGSRPGYTRRSA